jgi:ubiquinone/menaquinone biosynthesis C-methylase UbiE
MSIMRNAYYALPPVVRRVLRRIYYLPVDLYTAVTGQRKPMIPPRGKIFIGSGDFARTGDTIKEQLIKLAGLQPNHRILDVGCGLGRVAVPLTGYLDGSGSYEGFDIVKSAIVWCNKKISSQFPNFQFKHIDLKNDLYNLRTSRKAEDFVFPYPDKDFDLVLLTSVFTHMVLADVENYLQQIHRVLNKGGICFATFFIMNDDARQFMKQSGKELFKTKLEHYYLFNARVKEANVAFEEPYLVKEMIESKGFELQKVHYGFWSGRPKSPLENFQDICVFRKE